MTEKEHALRNPQPDTYEEWVKKYPPIPPSTATPIINEEEPRKKALRRLHANLVTLYAAKLRQQTTEPTENPDKKLEVE